MNRACKHHLPITGIKPPTSQAATLNGGALGEEVILAITTTIARRRVSYITHCRTVVSVSGAR